MSKKDQVSQPRGDGFDELNAMNNQSMQTVMRSYNVWLQSACRVQTEMLSFITKRIREDMEVPVRLAGCKSAADVVENQVSFAQTMLNDYADESKRILDLMSEASGEIQDAAGETATATTQQPQ